MEKGVLILAVIVLIVLFSNDVSYYFNMGVSYVKQNPLVVLLVIGALFLLDSKSMVRGGSEALGFGSTESRFRGGEE